MRLLLLAGARGRSAAKLATLAALGLAAAGLLGCAGHEDRTRTALEALDRGAPREAVASLDGEMKVARESDLPVLEGDNALLLLDRGSVQLGLDQFQASARDLGTADKAIDLLDLSRGKLDEVGKYMFSDDVGPYKAPAYEKLLINSVNLVNYLALSDLPGAKVEARRLAIMQKYERENDEETALLGLGSYLAGFAFEKSGDPAEALRFYDDALRHAQYPSLRDPLRVLTGGAPRSPGIDALVAGASPLPPVAETGEAELVVVIGFGRVPQKVPMRIPIGLALTLTAGALSPGNVAQANALAAKGLVTWINYPILGRSRGTYAVPTFSLDGRGMPLEEALDVENEVRVAWKKKEGTIIAAAVTRTITRLVAGEVAQAAATAAGGRNGGMVGLLAGLATTATLAVLDTPDTRCWATLPARIAIARLRVPAGRHELALGARGELKRAVVTLPPGGWAVVPMMVLR